MKGVQEKRKSGGGGDINEERGKMKQAGIFKEWENKRIGGMTQVKERRKSERMTQVGKRGNERNGK